MSCARGFGAAFRNNASTSLCLCTRAQIFHVCSTKSLRTTGTCVWPLGARITMRLKSIFWQTMSCVRCPVLLKCSVQHSMTARLLLSPAVYRYFKYGNRAKSITLCSRMDGSNQESEWSRFHGRAPPSCAKSREYTSHGSLGAVALKDVV
jgi:hypothetical protein